jgi:hypothetical protein
LGAGYPSINSGNKNAQSDFALSKFRRLFPFMDVPRCLPKYDFRLYSLGAGVPAKNLGLSRNITASTLTWFIRNIFFIEIASS